MAAGTDGMFFLKFSPLSCWNSHLNYATAWVESVSSRLGTLHEAAKIRTVEDAFHCISQIELLLLLSLLLLLRLQEELLLSFSILALCKFTEILRFNEKTKVHGGNVVLHF